MSTNLYKVIVDGMMTIIRANSKQEALQEIMKELAGTMLADIFIEEATDDDITAYLRAVNRKKN